MPNSSPMKFFDVSDHVLLGGGAILIDGLSLVAARVVLRRN